MPNEIDDLRERVASMVDIFDTILRNPTTWSRLSPQKREQFVTGLNKAYGQAVSFRHEYLTTLAAERKGRVVVTQLNADVTVGAADALFAKSVECKSVTAPSSSSVTEAIIRALKQLAGLTGHLPRPEDVRVIDVRIAGEANPWPFAGGAYGTERNPVLLGDLKSAAEKELKSIVESGHPGAMAVRRWLFGQKFGLIPNIEPLGEALPGFNRFSTRPIYRDPLHETFHKTRCLAIKIRYDVPYWIVSSSDGVSELVFQCYPTPDGPGFNRLVFQLVKIAVTHIDDNLNSIIKRFFLSASGSYFERD